MGYDNTKPNKQQYFHPVWESIRNNLNLLRSNEIATSFPDSSVNGQIAVRSDIENGALYQYINSSWEKLWSVDNGFNQDAIDTAYDNTTSGLTATDIKNAIDEVVSNHDTLDSNFTTHTNKGVDDTSTDITKDKHLSNSLAKGWTDHENSTSDPHNIQANQTDFDDTSFFTTALTTQAGLDALSSAGVVDEGSTADGDYIRYENGIQICFIEAEATYAAASLLAYRWNYPNSFIAKPSLSVNFDRDSLTLSADRTKLTSFYGDNSTILCDLEIGEGGISAPFISTDTGNVSGIAIGRWK